MVLYSKLFATRKEGVEEIISQSETLWNISGGPPISWQDFLSSLQTYIDSLPLPYVVPEPGKKADSVLS